MTRTQLEIPDAIARDAKEAGLLAAESVERPLTEALRKRALAALDETQATLDANPLPPMTAELIQSAIDANRAEKRAAAGT